MLTDKDLAFHTRPEKSPDVSYTLLAQAVANGKPQPEKPTALPINKLKLARGVFQPREIDKDIRAGEQVINALMRTIRTKKDHQLDPITVWWGGNDWFVVDGHHRLEAYRRLSKGKKPIKVKINVEVLEGTLIQAIAFANEANSIDKRAMSTTEKNNGAWRLVVLSEMETQAGRKGMSKAEIHRATVTSERTIASMRQKLKECLGEGIRLQDLLNTPWRKVGIKVEVDESQQDELRRKRVEAMSHQVAKAFTGIGRNSPEMIAEALVQYRRDLPAELEEIDVWVDARSSDEELDI
jgi:hypothetical protein